LKAEVKQLYNQQKMNLNHFIKSHGLGNDYIILDSGNINFKLTTKAIQRICDVHYGIGSDGILLKVPSAKADFGLKIYNPDGSEAEKSGNGLRIFCKYLFDYSLTNDKVFTVETLGGIVTGKIDKEVNGKASIVTIDMGKAIFASKDIPVNIDKAECMDETLQVNGNSYKINCVSVGNPHCIIIKDKLNKDEILKYGPVIETHKLFPNKINVQFVHPISHSEVEILIWERGAGYTLASGSSSCAVACILYKLGLTGNNVLVRMPGGNLQITINENWEITLTGEVKQIAEGVLHPELINDLELDIL
jgi:diaminopimelate epimerase